MSEWGIVPHSCTCFYPLSMQPPLVSLLLTRQQQHSYGDRMPPPVCASSVNDVQSILEAGVVIQLKRERGLSCASKPTTQLHSVQNRCSPKSPRKPRELQLHALSIHSYQGHPKHLNSFCYEYGTSPPCFLYVLSINSANVAWALTARVNTWYLVIAWEKGMSGLA